MLFIFLHALYVCIFIDSQMIHTSREPSSCPPPKVCYNLSELDQQVAGCRLEYIEHK